MNRHKFIISPDSFKGSLSALEVAEAIGRGVLSALDAEVVTLPIADGGEGTVDALGAKRVPCRVTGPDGEPVDSFFGLLEGNVAVIEMAAAAGLTLSKLHDPRVTTTYGVGELIRAALDLGCREFIVGLGGSATNDAACGMASALGIVFCDREGKPFIPTGGTLCDIADFDYSDIDTRVLESEFTAMCDITNPLYGESGAAYVFAPQKGADAETVKSLDDGLRNFAQVIADKLCYDISALPGGGAAGGMGAGVAVFLGAQLKSGIDTVLDIRHFDDLLTEGSVVITGEGRFDSQSAGGKAVSGVASRASAKGVPTVVLCGSTDTDVDFARLGVTAVFPIQSSPRTLEDAMARTASDLEFTAANVARLIAAVGGCANG